MENKKAINYIQYLITINDWIKKPSKIDYNLLSINKNKINYSFMYQNLNAIPIIIDNLDKICLELLLMNKNAISLKSSIFYKKMILII